jgi:hypothetical protein
LPQFQVVFCGNSSGHPNGFKLGYSCPCLIIVNPKLLSISLSDYPGLIFDPISFTIPLNVVYPHGVHYVRSRRRLNQVPRVFGL